MAATAERTVWTAVTRMTSRWSANVLIRSRTSIPAPARRSRSHDRSPLGRLATGSVPQAPRDHDDALTLRRDGRRPGARAGGRAFALPRVCATVGRLAPWGHCDVIHMRHPSFPVGQRGARIGSARAAAFFVAGLALAACDMVTVPATTLAPKSDF